MLFSIIKFGFKGKSAYKNPGEFVKSETKEVALSFLVFPIVCALIVLILLFIPGFTHHWGGPSLIARAFFYILLFGYVILGIPVYLFYKFVNKISKRAGQETERIFVKAEVKE